MEQGEPLGSIGTAVAAGGSVDGATAERSALHLLANARVIGMLWLAPDNRISRRLGPLTTPFEPGRSVFDTLPVFLGLEDEFDAVRSGALPQIILPNVSAGLAGAVLPKSTVLVMAGEQHSLLVTLFHAEAEAELEHSLAREVRERRLIEQRLQAAQEELVRNAAIIRDKNAELTAINAELEEFCSIISHDLSTPLRVIRHACLMEEAARLQQTASDGAVASAPADSAAVALATIREKSEYMSRMIRDLIEYATMGRKAEIAAVVDTRAVAEKLGRQLVPQPRFALAITGTWPPITTFRPTLELVLRNLLANAVHHHDQPAGVITLDGAVEAGIWWFSVADDGPGIATEDQAKVFAPFVRVANASGHEGSGIGLAQVKRAVEINGGTITLWSERSVRRGTVFTVKWPALALPG